MKLRILAIGKPRLRYADKGVSEYSKRLQRYAQTELTFLRDRKESEALLARSERCFRIALDERGSLLTTDQWTEHLSGLELRGEIKTVAFLIGGSDGHSSELRQQADAVWSLSSLTLQHELALVVLLEQLYRVFTIKRGEPYHRP